ncbi:MAG TPA: phospholipase [Thermoanaerobaculia bacterium]|nr:phospholipase [Thermoanaerobaculia bacterium]
MAAEAIVVEARTHGRYLVRPPAGRANGILIGYHGYLENAARHLEELERIPGLDDWALVAVDALHAFYSRSAGTGTVVRGWMTSDLRQETIVDNVRYLRSILDAVRSRFGWRRPVAHLGFSQGASMAWRAALLAGHEAAAAVALGGDIPPELAELPVSSPFPARALLARGEADEWYSAERLEADRAVLAPRAVEVETLVFAGGHEWSDPFRAAVAALLGRIAAGSMPVQSAE